MSARPGTPSEWLGTDQIRSLTVTSEDPGFPAEIMFRDDQPAANEVAGWRAGAPGRQIIQIEFPEPRQIRRIQLEFREPDVERTQEFSLSWAASPDAERREIVRQQWNFSRGGSTREFEDFRVNLEGVALLEIEIKPDIGGASAKASLGRLRIG